MQIIPLQPVPSQTLSVQLNNQAVSLAIYTLNTPGNILTLAAAVTADSTIVLADSTLITADSSTSLPTTELPGYPAVYVDVTLNGDKILTGQLARNLIPLLLSSNYLGFEGELVFVDTQNKGLQNGTDPQYQGLGAQYKLLYFSPADLAT